MSEFQRHIHLGYRGIDPTDDVDRALMLIERAVPSLVERIPTNATLDLPSDRLFGGDDCISVLEFANERRRVSARIVAHGDQRLPGGLVAVFVDDVDRLKIPVLRGGEIVIDGKNISDLLDQRFDIRVFFGDDQRHRGLNRNISRGSVYDSARPTGAISVKSFFPVKTGYEFRCRSVVLPDGNSRFSVANYGPELFVRAWCLSG